MSSRLTATILRRVEIELALHDERSRTRAMRIASKMNGVVRVEVVRERNLLVVIGVEIDCVKLTNSLRNRFPSAHVVSVGDIHSETPEAGFRQRDFYNYPIPQYYYQPLPYAAIPVHDHEPPMCSIL